MSIQYLGEVFTRADLDRFAGMTPGAVFRIVDEDAYVLWAVPPDDDQAEADDGTPGSALDVPEPMWVDVPEGFNLSRALVDGYWPYVIGADMVAAYPEVSADLANKIAGLAGNWAGYRDGRPWWNWWDAGAQLKAAGGVVFTKSDDPAGGFWMQPGKPESWLAWWHNDAWRTLFTVSWTTDGAPNGPEIYSGMPRGHTTRWTLLHDRNLFLGGLLTPQAAVAARAVPARAELVPARLEDDEATAAAQVGDAWDVGATVADLVALVNQLQDRIEALEAQR